MSQATSAAADISTELVQMRIVSSPPCWNGNEAQHGAQNLLHDGEQYFHSQLGHVRDLRFVFQAELSIALARFEWKGFGFNEDPARMSLEAQVGGEWKEVSTWDALRTAEWQSQTISSHLRSNTWRLTLLTNHGHPTLTVLKAVRFVKHDVRVPSVPFRSACPISAKLLSDRNFTDVEILVGESRFPAHRCMLAAASPVFSAMLCTEMREAQTGEIRLGDTDESSARATLSYIYTGVLAEDAPAGVASLAHTFEIDGLAEVAFPLALRNVTVENVAATYRMLKVYRGHTTLGTYYEELVSILQRNRELLIAALG